MYTRRTKCAEKSLNARESIYDNNLFCILSSQNIQSGKYNRHSPNFLLDIFDLGVT